MTAIEGVLHARALTQDGATRPLHLREPPAADEAWRLVCLGRDSLTARSWLVGESGLSAASVDALIADDTRPRAVLLDDGALIILRGVTLDQKGAFDDMVSVRLFVTPDRIVAVQRRRLATFDARIAALDRGEGAACVGAFLVGLVEAMRRDVEPVLDKLEQAVDQFELTGLESDRPPSARERGSLNAARHDAILIRRHVAPQADALRGLAAARPEWLTDKPLRERMKETADAFRRIAEDLDAVRARAVVVSDEAGLRVAEQTNRLVLRLSAVSIVFLPLTALTGLLGVNLEGIPYAEQEWSFAGFSALVAAVGGAVLLYLRLKRLL